MNNLPLIEVQEVTTQDLMLAYGASPNRYLETIEVQELFIEEEYTDEDYMTQAADLGLCPKFSLTYAEMKMHSLQAGWDEHGTGTSWKQRISMTANSFKAHTNNMTTVQPWEITQ